MGLQIIWFIIIAFFWTGFFILEGFDLGVGALHWSSARPTWSAGSPSTASDRSGTATRCG